MMTVVSGGPLTWFFVLPDGVTVRLTIDHVGLDDSAVRLSYPGLGIHEGFLDAEQGLIIAYAHGPETFVMRYDEPSVSHSELLGTNPWIDFSSNTPKLFKKVK
ncbi:hypothetical protein [Photorhabdus asymbiotica]|uniref:Uncharacterized protein n=2 Tax=Morganellaceae TaxID=1903414 RepID=C7BTZ6_PHOAA|nr:hypothetical protein [Photorhabdus asymbiotica]CAQ82158.1 conserved hypothetical protein [Photorhabdus asymbiotica]